jgi:hypothetical protein
MKRSIVSTLVVVFALNWGVVADVVTIVEPTADQQQIDVYNRKMRRGNRKVIATEQRFAVCLVEFNAAVDQPGDYAALKASVEAITGIESISLLIDGQAPVSIPEGKELRLYVEGHLRIDDAPVE